MALIHPRHSIEPHVFFGKMFIDPNLKTEPPFDPKSLFKNGEQGFWLDPNDLSTMFQDVLGSVPASVGQTVGAVLSATPQLFEQNIYDIKLNALDSYSWGLTDPSTIVLGNEFTTTKAGGLTKALDAAHKGKAVRIRLKGRTTVSLSVRNSGVLEGAIRIPVGEFDIDLYNPAIFSHSTTLYLAANGAGSVGIDHFAVDVVGKVCAYQVDSAKQMLLEIDSDTGYKYLKADGVDDFYITPLVDLTHTDKVTVIAAVRKLDDTGRGVVVEYGSGGAESGAFNINGPATNGSNTYAGLSRGAASSFPSVTGYAAPTSNVVRLISDISANRAELSVDGVIKSSPASNQGGGFFGNHKIFIGRRGGTSLPFSGRIYALLIIDRILTDAEIQKVEAEFAKRMGITL